MDNQNHIKVRPQLLLISCDDSKHEELSKLFVTTGLDLNYKETFALAEQTLVSQKFDIVLFDLTCEKVSDMLDLDNLINHDSHPPVIVVINSTQINLAQEALQNGAINFMVYPLDDDLIRKIITRELSNLLHIRKIKELEPVTSRNRLFLRIPSKLEYLGGIIYEILENAKRNEFPVDVYQHEIKLSLSEAVVNAIVHGNKRNEDKSVIIESTSTPDEQDIKLTITAGESP